MRKCISIVLAVVATGCAIQQSPPQGNSSAPAPAPIVHANVNVKSLVPEAIATLQSGLKDKNAYLRSNAIEAVVVTGHKELLPQITALTKDRTAAVRFAAAAAIGDLKCVTCEPQVRGLLSDESESVRMAAAYALVKLDQNRYADLIRGGLTSADSTARANAALLLGKLGNREDLPRLYEALYDADSNDKVRMQVVESIARLGDESMYRSKLWALQISKFADDRVMGIRGMGALNTGESRNAITTMLTDDIPEVRLAAAEQLARLGDKRGEEEVFNYLQTQTDLNQGNMANSMAIMAIGNMDSPRLYHWLPLAFKSQSSYLRIIAAQSVLLASR
ncbi:MAG: HEAT repeat domain-containing protein [Planctomycetaceae bacterium]|nr:HEAT repeat domain-containing protein [Planctomycetaceae bacterium]